MENPSLKFDPTNIPKYCPQCQLQGIKSKVKKFSSSEGEKLVMCKNEECPWPFSVVSQEEATIKISNNVGKKRKNEKQSLESTGDESQSSNSEKIETVPATSDSDKCKSPNNKKLKLADKPDPENLEVKRSKLKRSGCKEKEILNYIKENFSNSPKESVIEAKVETAPSDETDKKTGGEEAAREISKAEEDAQFFRAVPVAVRQPIRLPRHAANILSSRETTERERGEREKSPSISGDSDLECSGLSDLDDSDSELESLVSECSTMTAASETGSLASAEEGEGTGKKKRRGKKKKRKDRRKAHAGKCSKEQHRQSDLSLLEEDCSEKAEPQKNQDTVDKSSDVEQSKVTEVKSSDGSKSLKIRIKIGKPPDVEREVTKKRSRIKTISQKKPVEEPVSFMSSMPSMPSMSVSPEDKVSRMSTQSTVSTMSHDSVREAPVMSVSPSSPTSPFSPSSLTSEQDQEMSDLSTFQLKWNSFDPLSPMSVGDDQEVVEKEKGFKMKIQKSKPLPTVKAHQTPDSSETENVGFKEPATPTKVRPISQPSGGYSVPSPHMSDQSQYLSLPSLLSPMVPTPKSSHEEANSESEADNKTTDERVELGKKKSTSLDRIIDNLTEENNAKTQVKVPEKPVALPDGPYPRRRGRKSLSKKFQSEEPSPPPLPPSDPAPTRGRPAKNSQTSETGSGSEAAVAATPVKTVAKVIKLVGGRGLPPGLVPCAPPPGAKLIPCQPPKHLRTSQDKPPASAPSMFDLDEPDIVGNVQKALERQKENNKENPKKIDEIETTMARPAKTFSRGIKKAPVPDKKEVMVATSLNIETVVVPQETSIGLKTLSLASFEAEDPDFALVKKLGAGITYDKDLESSLREEPRVARKNQSQDSAAPNRDNSVVFHVSNQAMINQPTGSNNLEVKEHGETKVLLTADSNLIEVHDLKEGNTPAAGHVYRGRGRGRGARPVGRFIERDGVLVNQMTDPETPTCGEGWFKWRDWTVNVNFLKQYTDHINKLIEKHKAKISKTSSIDSRISALLLEKQTNFNPGIEKTNDFFAEVYVKYLYLKSNFSSLGTEAIINIVSENYSLDNIDFARGLKKHPNLERVQPQPPVPVPRSQGSKSTMKLPDNVKTQMIVTALSSNQQANQGLVDHPPPQSPSQPINLSLSATDVPLPPSPTSPGPPSVQSIQPSTPLATRLQVKAEPLDYEYNVGSVQVVSVPPASCQLYSNGGCSVQLASVSSSTPGHLVGTGPKILQFFYQNPVDDIKIGFPPVRVTTEEEVKCVVALVTEKAEDFNRRNNLGQKGKPVQYTSLAVQARSILSQEIISHIEKCFTKKGMKDMAPGRKKRAYPKRNEIIKVPSNYFNKIKQENGDIIEEAVEDNEPPVNEEEAEDDVDEVDDLPEQPVIEHIPTQSELTEDLECEVFGGQMPKVSLRKENRIRNLDRKGRGGRNEVINQKVPENLVLDVVGHLLDKPEDTKIKEGSLNLTSLFKKRGRRKKKRQDVDDFSEEDEYVVPSYAVKSSVEGSRKSKRITMKIPDGELKEAELLVNAPATLVNQQSEKENLNTFNIHEVPPVPSPTEKSAREKKLDQIREICSEKLKEAASVTSPSHRFVEPNSGSEDEQVKKGKLKRGMKAREVEAEASQEEVEEMIRCVSRASRPGSQASSRPGSQLSSRPSSALPMKVAKKLEGLGSPERDSPVLTPRVRKKEAIEKQQREALQKAISPRAATPVSGQSVGNENYLRKNQTVQPTSQTLRVFEQSFTRKKQSEKIQKLLKKQMRKAEKSGKKKYQGFGDPKVPDQEDVKKEERKEIKKTESIVKKAQVSKAEVDLIMELLELGETAVAAATDSYDGGNQTNYSGVRSTEPSESHVSAIRDFEECQTIQDDSQNLSEELDQLFDLS